MILFLAGLIIFLGIHSFNLAAPAARAGLIARMGAGPWKGVYSLISLASFLLMIYGYGIARQTPVVLWNPPEMLRHLNALFMLLAFIFFVAAYVPRNSLKARFGHPMFLSVKLWAIGHLLANGTLDDIILFGAFLVWAVFGYAIERRRDRAAGVVYPPGRATGNILIILIGLVVFLAFAFYLHQKWIGVNPMA